MARIPRDFIDRLVDDSDIVSVLGQYLNLTKKSSNYVTNCPFHEEKTASFTVSPQKSIYHCFGCKKGGNVLTFLQDYDGLTFLEAVEKLAEINGVQMPQSSKNEYDNFSSIYAINKIVADHYYSFFMNNPSSEATNYLKERGIEGKTVKNFLIGFSENNQTQLLNALLKQFSEKDILTSGTFLKNDKGIFPFFRNRIMFPINNIKGNIIGFGGRALGDQLPKYLNSKDSPFFRKSRELYGFDKARSCKGFDYFFVTEGYMDVDMLHQHGVDCAVASLGTSFTNQHLNNLFRYKNKVIFCFDSDEAGLKAAWRALNISLSLAIDDKTIRFMFLPEGEDPDSFINANGRKALLDRIERSMDIETFVFQFLKRKRDLESSEDIRIILFELKKILSSVRSDFLKETLLAKFAKELNINKETILRNQANVKKEPKVEKTHSNDTSHEKNILLLIYLLDLFKQDLKSDDFMSFLSTSDNEDMQNLMAILQSISNDGGEHKENSTYASAMMISLKITADDAREEFERASDELRLKFDQGFLTYLAELANKKQLSQPRKERLQKLLNLKENTSDQEQQLIQLLNAY